MALNSESLLHEATATTHLDKSTGVIGSHQESFTFTSTVVEMGDLSGDIESAKNDISHNLQYSSPSAVHRPGMASEFLSRKGFAWLLEEDVDEDDQKPLLEELDIDISDIYFKLRCVLLPLPYFKTDRSVLRDNPDFWGPLVVVILYSIVSLYGQLSVVSWIMTIWLFGSAMIFLLARVLGGNVHYSQCLGVIGYSVLPLVIIGVLLPISPSVLLLPFFLKLLGISWSTYSAGSLLCVEDLQQKRVLLLYPLFLLFIYFFSLYSGV